MIRDYANSVTCTLQRDRCTFKVNVGSADLSYDGCTIWHNSGRTYTLNIYVDTRCSLWERVEYLESADDHENPISSRPVERDRVSGALSSSSSVSTKRGLSPYYSRYRSTEFMWLLISITSSLAKCADVAGEKISPGKSNLRKLLSSRKIRYLSEKLCLKLKSFNVVYKLICN